VEQTEKLIATLLEISDNEQDQKKIGIHRIRKQVLRRQERADRTSIKNRLEYKTITPDHSLELNAGHLSHYN
jgi:hypothetical protein